MITVAQLIRIMPHINKKDANNADLYYPFLTAAMQKFDINTVLRMAAFLAQIGHETFDLNFMEEEASGQRYEGRKDLGNVNPGDGPRYKGRGALQLTGRANYHKYGELLGIDLENNPEQAGLPQASFLIAGLYWAIHDLNLYADNRDMMTITKKINGGYTDMDKRLSRYARAMTILTEA